MPELTLQRRFAAHKEVVWQHGLVGGIVSGLVMGAFLMVVMAITGDSFFRPLELIGSIWYGAMTTGAAAIVLGLVTHVVMSAILGVLYALLIPYGRVDPLLQGLVYGAVVWFLAQIVVLPQVGAYISAGYPVWAFLLGHLPYGIGLGSYEDWADRRTALREGV